MKARGIAHTRQLALANIFRKADIHLIALDWIGVVAKSKDRSTRLVRYREARGIDLEIGFRVIHVQHPFLAVQGPPCHGRASGNTPICSMKGQLSRNSAALA